MKSKVFLKPIMAIMKIPEIKLKAKSWIRIIYNFIKTSTIIIIQKVIRVFGRFFWGHIIDVNYGKD